MRKVFLLGAAALVLGLQLAAPARADETTVIRKDRPDEGTTVIRKEEGVNVFPVPHTEERKTIIHHDD
jgi:hypothetical protein